MRHFRKSPPASVISSDIAPALAATGGNQTQADETAARRQLAPAERVRHRRRPVASRRKNGIARIPASQPSAAAAGSAPFALSPPLWRMCRRSRRESLKPAERRRRRTSRQIAENAYGAKPHREGRGFSREPAWLIRCHDHRMGANRFVYILRRESKPDEPYVGCTSDVPSRLHWRNHGPNGYTTQHRPWRLLAGVECADESTAFRFERYLKTGSVRAFAKRHFG